MWQVEHVPEDDITAWLNTPLTALLAGQEYPEEALPFPRSCVRYGVRDDGWVGSAAHFLTDLTLPGGASVPAGAVTLVGVLPTHRRRGILHAMMDRQLHELRDAGCGAALLYASESRIYGRYGYGPATRVVTWSVDRTRAAAAPPTGALRLITADEARTVLPKAFERFGCRTPGSIGRPDGLWEARLADPASRRGGASRSHIVVHDGPGGIDGFARYRLKDDWDQWLSNGTAIVQDVCADTPAIEADLWRYLLSLDLVQTVRRELPDLPPDHVLPWLLDDPRAARTGSMQDGLWLRPIDIRALLEGRTYITDVDLTFRLADPQFDDVAGDYAVATSGGHAEVAREPVVDPDVHLSAGDLGALLLGGCRPAPLVEAGRIRVRDADALDRLARLFLADRDPWCSTFF